MWNRTWAWERRMRRAALGGAGAVLLLAAGAAARAAPVLVDTEWASRHLEDAQVVLVDMSASPQYSRFHLPGAVALPYERLLRERPADRLPVPLERKALYALLGTLGISASHHVVIYDDMGGLNAGRLFWELERIGHRQVSVLDGGLVKWVLEGRRVVNTPAYRPAVVYRPAAAGRANQATIDDVLAAARSRDAVLLDVRTEEEYRGSATAPRSGHVPGARWWPWDRSVDLAGGFTRAPEAALRQGLAQLGVTDRAMPLLAYCRSGHRAAQSYLVLRSLGFDNVRLYANSMNEYQRVPSAPLVRGAGP